MTLPDLRIPRFGTPGHLSDRANWRRQSSEEVALMLVDDDLPFLTIDETAALLRINRRTLDNLRWREEGPPARRHGGRIVYHRDEVLEWSERRRTRAPPAGEKEVEPRHNGDALRSRGRDAVPTPPASPPKRKS